MIIAVSIIISLLVGETQSKNFILLTNIRLITVFKKLIIRVYPNRDQAG